jgi:hypothetical protein
VILNAGSSARLPQRRARSRSRGSNPRALGGAIFRFADIRDSCGDNRVKARAKTQADVRLARESAAKANQIAKALRFWVGLIRNTSLQEIL